MRLLAKQRFVEAYVYIVCKIYFLCTCRALIDICAIHLNMQYMHNWRN